jgi:methyltransferase (TIGR00027 family)
MDKKLVIAPESTAARVALWRALHLEIDSAPHVITDKIGLQLIAPVDDWKARPDMDPQFTKMFRASIVARARYIDDLVIEHSKKGIDQYIILGAGLDTFAERNIETASKIKIFEVDMPGPQKWKEQRLHELGFKIPEGLHFVPVDFEAGESWLEKLSTNGFDKNKPALIASTGVSMYLTKEANFKTLQMMSTLTKGSILAMTYLLPAELINTSEKAGLSASQKGAKSSGTPFISFFSPEEICELAKKAGFKEAHCVFADELNEKYFSNRTDDLKTGKAEAFLIAKV